MTDIGQICDQTAQKTIPVETQISNALGHLLSHDKFTDSSKEHEQLDVQIDFIDPVYTAKMNQDDLDADDSSIEVVAHKNLNESMKSRNDMYQDYFKIFGIVESVSMESIKKVEPILLNEFNSEILESNTDSIQEFNESQVILEDTFNSSINSIYMFVIIGLF